MATADTPADDEDISSLKLRRCSTKTSHDKIYSNRNEYV